MNIASSRWGENPFVGPTALQSGQPIFGRDREITELTDLLAYKRVVLLQSPSGAGKTSLIQAGLIPALEKLFSVARPVIRVGKEPPPGAVATSYNRYLLSVYGSLEDDFPEGERKSLAELAAMGGLRAYMADRRERRARLGDESARLAELLIFDQFEEVLSLNPIDRDAKRAFFAELGGLLYESQYLALFAMREDYAAALEEYLQPLPDRLAVRFALKPLGERPAKEVVDKLLQPRDVTFEPEALSALVTDLCQTAVHATDGTIQSVSGEFVEPVQLQVVGRWLWANRREADKIDRGDLQSLRDAALSAGPESLAAGGASQSVSTVDLALEAFYQQEVARVAQETGVAERLIRDWFEQQLLTPQGLRSQVLRAPGASQGLANEAIDALDQAHLVRREERRGLSWYELAHDRLIRPVQSNNRAWYAANLQPFQHTAAAWLRQGRPSSLLLAGRELQEALAWPGEKTAGEVEFLQAGQEMRRVFERERHAERGTNLADTGWGIIFAADADPAIRDALSELLEHRRRQATERRTEFYKEFTGSRGYQRGDSARQFLARHRAGFGPTSPDKMPYYLLLVGDPISIPFEFQYALDERYAVGRLHFDTLEAYASYARSVVLAETGQFSLARQLAIFSPRQSDDRATAILNEQLARPLREDLQAAYPDWEVRLTDGPAAGKSGYRAALGGEKTPALFFSAGHGLAGGLDSQRTDYGALVTEDWPDQATSLTAEHLFTANDVDPNASLVGLIAFLFHSYSAGTPQQSDFLSRAGPAADAPSSAGPAVAHLPQRLLGHLQGGALGVIGHVDDLRLHSLKNEDNTYYMGAIADVLDRLMRGHTIGAAMESLNLRYTNAYNLLAEELIQVALRGKPTQPGQLEMLHARAIDARNHILLGDPAARLPLDAGPIPSARLRISPVAVSGRVAAPARRVEPAAPPPAPTTESQSGPEKIGGAPAPEPGSKGSDIFAPSLAFNGVVASTGAPLLALSLPELAAFIAQQPPDRELERELRWYLDSRARAASY